jgi:hypothetical protein
LTGVTVATHFHGPRPIESVAAVVSAPARLVCVSGLFLAQPAASINIATHTVTDRFFMVGSKKTGPPHENAS